MYKYFPVNKLTLVFEHKYWDFPYLLITYTFDVTVRLITYYVVFNYQRATDFWPVYI